ncbi:MAG: hypothetical protein AB7D48_15165 [Acidocella sp.]
MTAGGHQWTLLAASIAHDGKFMVRGVVAVTAFIPTIYRFSEAFLLDFGFWHDRLIGRGR